MTQSFQRPGMLLTMVGPAGAGKNQLINDMIARYAGRAPRVCQFPTATTRAKRDGEQDGREHHFVTVERFKEMIQQDELLEWQLVHGKGTDRYYGMPRATLEAGLDAGDVLMADIEYLGAKQVKAQYPDNVIAIFVMPPSVSALIERMRNRATEGETEISKRLLRVPAELEYANECDYVILNDSFAEASSLLYGIVAAEVAKRRRAQILSSFLVDRFTYSVRVIPVIDKDGAYVPVTQPPYPEADLPPETSPVEKALEIVRRTIDPNAEASRLIAAPPSHYDDYVPPLHLDYLKQADGHERVYFVYKYLTRP